MLLRDMPHMASCLCRLFIIPSFKIYGGVAGLFDYGPPGCAVKSNVLAFWRQVRAP